MRQHDETCVQKTTGIDSQMHNVLRDLCLCKLQKLHTAHPNDRASHACQGPQLIIGGSGQLGTGARHDCHDPDVDEDEITQLQPSEMSLECHRQPCLAISMRHIRSLGRHQILRQACGYFSA